MPFPLKLRPRRLAGLLDAYLNPGPLMFAACMLVSVSTFIMQSNGLEPKYSNVSVMLLKEPVEISFFLPMFNFLHFVLLIFHFGPLTFSLITFSLINGHEGNDSGLISSTRPRCSRNTR